MLDMEDTNSEGVILQNIHITASKSIRTSLLTSGNTYYYIVTLTCYVFPVGSVVADSQSVVSHSKTLQAMRVP
jgi:hypothetical protein